MFHLIGTCAHRLIVSTQFIKNGKPTGSAECPPHIERAFEIDDLINERAGTRDVNDSELDEPMPDEVTAGHDAIEISSDEEPERVVATVKRVDQSEHAKKPRVSGIGLIQQIVKSLDPSAQLQRDTTRAEHNLSTVQIITLSQQLRDAHQAVHGLRTDIARLYSRLHAAEAARDRAELKLELIGDRSTRSSRKRKWHHRSDVISLDGSDTEPADDVDKENHPPDRGRGLKRSYAFRIENPPVQPQPFPVKFEDSDMSSTPKVSSVLSSDTDLPSPSIAFV